MNHAVEPVLRAMIAYDRGDPMRIHHLLKVHSFARLIGLGEQLDAETQFLLETAAVVHDIGIRIADEKYGHHEGPLQEQEGPAAARPLLARCGLEEAEIDRQCWLIAHHHTYTNVTELDHQILLEADFLVNSYESDEPMEAILAMRKNVFRTATGIRLLNTMFAL